MSSKFGVNTLMSSKSIPRPLISGGVMAESNLGQLDHAICCSEFCNDVTRHSTLESF